MQFSTVQEFFHIEEFFPQTRKFCTKFFFLDLKSFSPEKKKKKKKNERKNQKGSIKFKILDSFNSKLYPKVFLTL